MVALSLEGRGRKGGGGGEGEGEESHDYWCGCLVYMYFPVRCFRSAAMFLWLQRDKLKQLVKPEYFAHYTIV